MSLDLFSPSDYSSLAIATGVEIEILARRLSAKPTPRLTDFKVHELKEIHRWIKTRPNWQANPIVQQRIPPSASGTTGKKQQLVEHLKLILQRQAHPLDTQDTHNSMHGSTSAIAMQQAQLRQHHQQAQAQAQAVRYQSTDPYRYQAAASSSSRPMQSGPQQGYAQAGYGSYAQPPQQFAYTNGTRDSYGQMRYPQQQVSQQPQMSGNGYHSMYNQYGQVQSTASSSSSLSHPALQHQSRQAEITQLTNHPNMLKHLSPYEHVVQALARNLLNASSHTPNQSTGAAGGAYHTTLTFNIAQAYLSKIKRPGRPIPSGQESQMLEVQLRLFSAITMEHFPWDKKFRVLVNGHEVTIPEPKKLSKTKKKGLELVRGLDISEFVQASNTVEVSVYRQSYAVELFRGLVSADLVRIRDTSELMDQFRKTVKDEESKMQATALERSCVICHSKKDPLRCSRCKNEWYCGAEHQRQHWSTHREHCAVPTPEQDALREAHEKKAAQLAMLGKNGRTKLVIPVKVKPENGEDDLEDGVEEVDALVSLRCPLSLERCEYPARGRNCGHLPCFNLETYLMFSHQSGVWQCPICFKGLPWEEIEVNLQMAAILRETDSEISQIRVHPDGQYDPIKAIPDGETGDGREPGSRKRKQPSSSPTPPAGGPPAKLQAVGTTPDLAQASAAASDVATGGDVTGSSSAAPPNGSSFAVPSWNLPSGAIQPNASPSPAPPQPAPSPPVSAAGTADEPIELD